MKRGTTLLGLGLAVASLPLVGQDPKAAATADFFDVLDFLNTKVEVASKSSEKLSDAPGIISVLTKDDLNRFGGTTLADVLNRVPGLLHVSNYFTDRSMMGSRGDVIAKQCTNRHVLVLFDGRPVREVQEGGIKSDVYESFPIAAIDHIEVIKGPGSVLYGSEAYSGVINIVTEKPKDNGGMIFGSFGEQEAYNHSFKMTMANKDFSLLVAGKQSKRPDWNVTYDHHVGSPDKWGTRQHTFIDSGDGLFVKGNYKNLQVTTSFLRYKPSEVIPDNLLQPPLSPLDPGNLSYQKTFFDASYLFDFSKMWKMSLSATANRSEFQITTGSFPDIMRDSRESLAEMTHFLHFNDKFKLTLGGLYSYVKGYEKMIHLPIQVSKGSRDGYAGYGQVDLQFLDNLKGIAGFQTIKVGKGDVKTVPRAGAIWYPTKRVNIKALYGEAFRAPYVNEALADFPGLKGTPTLAPELVKAFESSVSYLGDNFEITASAFRNKQTNLISYKMLNESDGRPTYINESDPVIIEGGEIEGKYYLNKSLYLNGSILLQRCKEVPTGIANQSGKLGASYSTELGVISLFSLFQGNLSESLHNRASKNPQSGSYTLVSLHGELNLNKTFNWAAKPQAKLVLQGDNLLNKEIWVNAMGDTYIAETIPFKKGRVVYLGAQFSF